MFGFGGETNSTDSMASGFNQELESMAINSNSSMKSSSPDNELQQVLMVEQQRAQFQAQVHRLNDICWEVCVEKPSNKLDGRTEACLGNCVNRFIDTTLTITNRFAQMLQQSGGNF